MTCSAFDKESPLNPENNSFPAQPDYAETGSLKLEKPQAGKEKTARINEAFLQHQPENMEESVLHNLFRRMPQPAVLTRLSDNRVVDCSDFFESMSGLSRARIIGRTSIEFGAWDDENERSRFLEIVARDGKIANFEARLRDPDGNLQSWLLSAQTIDLGGNGHMLISFTNIEDRVKAEVEKRHLEEQLRQQQKLETIGTMAGGVAHEINNPINIIMNFAELIKDDAAHLAGTEVIRDYAAQIISESGRISSMVRNLLSFSRQENEQYTGVEISQIVEATAMLTHRILAKDDITLSVDVESELPPVMCRGQQIMQVLMNLLINARDALNERYEGYHQNKSVEIKSAVHIDDAGKWLRTSVEDHGCGIKEENRRHIFEPFFSTKAHGLGTGLGLSVSLGIIEEHSGRLSFESEEGRGSIFHIDLPLERNR